jgi:magnesium transporter
MQAYFQIRDGAIVTSTPDEATIHVFAAPSEAERQQILATLQIDRYDLESALDPDEISRIEFGPARISAIWKRPMSASFDERLRLEVASVGLFLHAKGLTVVMGDDNIPFEAKDSTALDHRATMLRFLLHTVRHYLAHLKVIKQITQELESKISTSMENRYLLQMFALGEPDLLLERHRGQRGRAGQASHGFERVP